jgi:hypothetical protein
MVTAFGGITGGVEQGGRRSGDAAGLHERVGRDGEGH